MYFHLPLGKGRGSSLNKLEFSSLKDALCQVWLKLALWFLIRRFLNFVKVFTLFRNYLPLAKGGALHLSKLEFPSLIDVLCQVLLILAQWLWRRKWKCEKFTMMTTTTTKTTTTDNWQILIRKTNLSLSLWLRWAKNNRKLKR